MPGYFVWQVPGQPVVVHLSVDVVDRMSADILRGFGAVPKRGAEVGGILIGTVTPGKPPGDVSTVRIEDFEAIPCTYARGPSYLLTDTEQALFDETCHRRRTEIVGYYRSHTRDGLALQPEDIQLLDQLFPAAAQVALLVKPFATKPGTAGFFVRKNGAFPAATPLEFPFRRWEMTGQEPPRRAPMQERKRREREPEKREEAAAVPPMPSEEAPASAPQSYYRIFSAEPEEPPKKPAEEPGAPKSRTGMWLVASFVFLLLGVLLGYEASRITAPQRAAADFALSLAVERTGENLTVRWNPNARAVVSASNGELEIDDGADTKRVALDRANLSSGSMVYRNASNKVGFRLVLDSRFGVKCHSGVGVDTLVFAFFCKARQHRQLLQVLLQRPGRRAPHDLPRADDLRSQHAASGTQHGARFNPRLVADPYLSADDRVIFDHHAAGESRLRRDDHMTPDPAVVSNVHQVVELAAFADGSNAQRGAIHAGISANLHVVGDHHPAHLRKFFVSSLGQDKAKTVGSNDAARVQDHVIPEGHVVIHRHARVQHAAPPDMDIIPDDSSGSNRGSVANVHSRAQAHQGTDGSAFADHDAGAQYGGWMNAWGRLAMGMQLRYDASNGGAGVARADDGAAGFVDEIVGDQQARGVGEADESDGAPVGDERKVFLARVFERRHTADFAVSFALPGRFQPSGQFFDAQTFGLL